MVQGTDTREYADELAPMGQGKEAAKMGKFLDDIKTMMTLEQKAWAILSVEHESISGHNYGFCPAQILMPTKLWSI